ncbi:hypothetical protein MES5069_480004 [Mesorhizobium escarrei]|uniref:Uncharacterized protein n=1 Tax=Mesorhizobium escarrei TaxID=666018 RepID=A0ABM9E8V2_9HYPH|nr:hypothetical protein MES5069_480004 [Mesorhizobium escarrei]
MENDLGRSSGWSRGFVKLRKVREIGKYAGAVSGEISDEVLSYISYLFCQAGQLQEFTGLCEKLTMCASVSLAFVAKFVDLKLQICRQLILHVFPPIKPAANPVCSPSGQLELLSHHLFRVEYSLENELARPHVANAL